MRLPRTSARKRGPRPDEAVILFAVGGMGFAIAAAAVDEIRTTTGVRPLAHSPRAQASLAKVRGVLDRDGRPYYVVDASHHFHLLPARASRLLVLRRRAVAVLVERIERMAEISALYALPRAFTGEERRWYRGLALLPGPDEGPLVVPVVNPEAFLSAPEMELAAQWSQAQGAPA